MNDDLNIKAGKALINADDVEEDPNFAESLTGDFYKAEPKGEDLIPKNPLIKEKGEDLIPQNPLHKEKGEDLGAEFYEIVVGEIAHPNANVSGYVDDTHKYGTDKYED